MAHTQEEMRALSDEDLRRAYNREATTTTSSLDLYRQEIQRRELEAHSQQMLRLTEAMRQMTADIRRWTRVLMWLAILMAVVAVLQLVMVWQ